MVESSRSVSSLIAQSEARPSGLAETGAQALSLVEDASTPFEDGSAKDALAGARGQRAPTRAWAGRVEAAKLAIAREGVAQLDESEELSGIGGAYDAATGSKRAMAAARKGREGVGSAKAKAPSAVGVEKQPKAGKAIRQARDALTRLRAGAGASVRKGAEAKAGVSLAASTAAAPVIGVALGIVAFVLAVLLVSQLVSALFGFWDNEARKAALSGLPPYITYEMVEEALACQEEYGHPAGCTIAQIIVESGMGDRLSQLAATDHNLFGMKWSSAYAGCPEVTGKSSWVTGEEYGGQSVVVTAQFITFAGDAECIRFRSRVFLQAPRYAGNALIAQAVELGDSDKMAEGLKDAGWATSSSYVESLTAVMDAYGLRRFDSMTVEDFRSSYANADAIVQAAFSQLGVPYVWGGASPGVALDCSGLTQYCYAQAGIRISHYTEYQREELEAIPLSQAQPGDILYRSGHVAIYIGDDRYIHAPHSGAVVCIATGKSQFTCALTARR